MGTMIFAVFVLGGLGLLIAVIVWFDRQVRRTPSGLDSARYSSDGSGYSYGYGYGGDGGSSSSDCGSSSDAGGCDAGGGDGGGGGD